jgi:hypothetical protein
VRNLSSFAALGSSGLEAFSHGEFGAVEEFGGEALDFSPPAFSAGRRPGALHWPSRLPDWR